MRDLAIHTPDFAGNMRPKTSAVLEAQNLGCAGQGWVSQGIGTVIMRGGEPYKTGLGRGCVVSYPWAFCKLPKGELIPTSLHGGHGVNRSTMYKHPFQLVEATLAQDSLAHVTLLSASVPHH